MGRTQRKRAQHKKAAEQFGNELTVKPLTHNFLPALIKHMSALGWRNQTELAVRNFALTGRGLCSKSKTFIAGDELMRLPFNALITIASLEADEDFKAQFDCEHFKAAAKVPFQCLMALYLLHQLHLAEKSQLQAYINALPANFTVPFFCPLAELQCLPEIILQKTVAKQRKIREILQSFREVLKRSHCHCCGKAYLDEIYNLTALRWAYFAVNTRSVFLKSNYFMPKNSYFQALLADAPDLGMVPLLDMFNHSDAVSTNAELLRSENKQQQLEFVLTLLHTDDEAVKPWQQIFISYGSLTNLQLFSEYGFFLRKNKHDYFEFTLMDIEAYAKSCSWLHIHRDKFKFIRQHNLQDQMFVDFHVSVSHNLHVVLQLLFLEQSHYANVLSQFAFGAAELLLDVSEQVQQLINFKIREYENFINGLNRLQSLSESGRVALAYLQNCVHWLQQFLLHENLNGETEKS